MVANGLVSDEAFRPSSGETPKSRGKSLRADFSISEIYLRECPETGCVSAETGSNPQFESTVRQLRLRQTNPERYDTALRVGECMRWFGCCLTIRRRLTRFSGLLATLHFDEDRAI